MFPSCYNAYSVRWFGSAKHKQETRLKRNANKTTKMQKRKHINQNGSNTFAPEIKLALPLWTN